VTGHEVNPARMNICRLERFDFDSLLATAERTAHLHQVATEGRLDAVARLAKHQTAPAAEIKRTAGLRGIASPSELLIEIEDLERELNNL
jgi:hypothetical protein